MMTGYGLMNGFIALLHTPLRTTSNYSATADLHTLQITAANIKSSSASNVFKSRFLVTDVNSENSSDPRTQVLPARFLYKTDCQLSTNNSQVGGHSTENIGPLFLCAYSLPRDGVA
jgi:hypothetical protein